MKPGKSLLPLQLSRILNILILAVVFVFNRGAVAIEVTDPYYSGALQVTIAPDEAAASGATWQIDGDSFWHRSGDVVSADWGFHYITFRSAVPGWQAPWGSSVTVAPWQTTTLVTTFSMVTGSLTVTFKPSLALQCGGKWQIDGGEWKDSGTTISGVIVGSHLVTFKDVYGWLAPTSRVVSISANKTNSTSAEYVGGKVSPISLNGKGSVSPNVAGRLLQVGKAYTVTAEPASGWLFTGWNGSLATSKQKITFTLLPETSLVANFCLNPFGAVKGSYSGLFYETNSAGHGTSGYLKLQVSGMGAYTGTLVSDGSRSVLSGKFDILGCATNVIASKAGPFTEIRMNLAISGETGVLWGAVVKGDWSSALHAERSVQNPQDNPVRNAGSYTMLLGPRQSEEGPGPDKGIGYATVKLASGGAVQLKLRLADGTKLEGSGSISKRGNCPIYLPLYKNKGSIFGWLRFVNASEDYDLLGELLWTRPSITGSSVYPEGFCDRLICQGCRYVPPAKGSPVFAETNSCITFMGGNLGAEFGDSFFLNPNNRATNLGTNMLVMGVAPASGIITGTIAVPSSGEVLRFEGSVLQKLSTGGGYFMHTNRSGYFLISPR